MNSSILLNDDYVRCTNGWKLYPVASINIFITGFIIYTLNKLEDSHCNCADIKEKKYIKEFFIFYMIFYLFLIVSFIFSDSECWENYILNNSYFTMFALIISFIYIVMLFRLFLYIRILKNTCNCGYKTEEKFLYWYLLISFSILFALIAIAIVMIIITYIMLFRSKSKINNMINNTNVSRSLSRPFSNSSKGTSKTSRKSTIKSK